MNLIDTHAHLDSPKIYARLDEVLANAKEAGVDRIVTIGASRGMDSNRRALEIARQYDWIRCTIGLHPHDAESADEATVELLRREFAGDAQVVGIGETGLDYFYDNAPVDKQKWAFRQFLEMSKEFNKPVIIHSRDADEDCIAMLKETGVTGGILHCFTGSRWMAEELFELDFYLSFSGIVTFKSAAELLEIARDTPLERILVETDSPYLAPIPHRGRPNEPAYLRHTAEKIAEARGMSFEEFAQATTKNASRVFDWPLT
ncbi:TatD family hydrolase [Bradymonas sediminis]|uniref:Hydrolase TatD n=1 Tax=Bradymonas sediminis TaxID=1548548 RepID=A0A2Z4FIW5_9DELT|nr:TatD family hydrolase [Bradymonas sediminis]AWV88800.1 hydrolase TatD [Bradymonas sediminis]TDP71798.1 TatD DNase family protein [Bradymonas sediminis]